MTRKGEILITITLLLVVILASLNSLAQAASQSFNSVSKYTATSLNEKPTGAALLSGANTRSTLTPHEGKSGAPELNETYMVNLVTGDTVVVANTSAGLKVISIRPADPQRRGQGFHIIPVNGHLYVIPSYVDVRKYDLSLFDVAYLVKEGYYKSPTLPLIVKAQSAEQVSALAQTLPKFNATAKQVSRHMGLAAVKVKNDAKAIADVFRNVLEKSDVAKVWLDKKVHASLDVSVPLIGATQAWSAGYNGSGVKIAILDTGIDPHHPDFYFPNGTYKVILNQSFVDYPPEEVGNATDLMGHGTHVASIAAGTGLASHGKYTGVAPGALLMVGKVLNRWGWGYYSWIISGIEWAVANGANIISMSLGDGFGTGDDPLSQACDWATSQGVVVVVANGNDGPSYFTVTVPGAAKNVIAVGASDKADAIAWFSSRGPTLDLRIKPDIVAPGVSIWAALARGSLIYEWVIEGYLPGYDANGDGVYDYVALSGTSMATPHVSGAAAIVLQKFPGLKPSDVKNLLLSTSNVLPGYNVYQQGAGRLNVSYALNPVLILDPAEINIGVPLQKVVNTTITLKSLYDGNVTVAFNVTFSSVDHPEVSKAFTGAFYIANGTVTLAPHGAANVTFAANFTSLPRYDFYGVIYIVNASNRNQVLAHGVFSAFKYRKLVVEKIDRSGNPAAYHWVGVSPNATRSGSLEESLSGLWFTTNASGFAVFYLPEGVYNVFTDNYYSDTGSVYAIVKQVNLTSDTVLFLDEREAKAVTLGGVSHLTPIEKSVVYTIPTFYDNGYSSISYGWIIYYPSSTVDYILTPNPASVGYKLVPSDAVNPSDLDLIISDALYMLIGHFDSVATNKTIPSSANVSSAIEYRTLATPMVSLWTSTSLDYDGPYYWIWHFGIGFKVNAPKVLRVLMNPFWLGTSVEYAGLFTYGYKNRDLPRVSTPYWEYYGWAPVKWLYENKIYTSKIILPVEPEYTRAYSWFWIKNNRTLGLDIWSYFRPSLNDTQSGYSRDFKGKVLINGTDITNQLSVWSWQSYGELWTDSINFSLPVRVEAYINWTSPEDRLSRIISSRIVTVLDNSTGMFRGNGWYWFTPIELDYSSAFNVIGLDSNNTLTTLKPVKLVTGVWSQFKLSRIRLMYRFSDSWRNATLVSATGFSSGWNSFTFALDPMVNNTYVDISVHIEDVAGNVLEENITKAFYVSTVIPGYNFTVSVSGINGNRTGLYLDGNLVAKLADGESYTFVGLVGSHVVSVDSVVQGPAGTRYVCSNSSITISSLGSHTFSYVTQYYLTISADPSNAGTVSPGSGWYEKGKQVTISATANAGYVFKGWVGSGNGSYSGPSNPATVTMNAPITEVAKFVAVGPLSISISDVKVVKGVVKINFTVSASAPIKSASYVIDGSESPLTPVDGSFNATVERFHVEINGTQLSEGFHSLYLKGATDYNSTQVGLRVFVKALGAKYNLVSLAVQPLYVVKASDFLTSLGPAATGMWKYDSSKQKFVAYVPNFALSADFTIEAGEGYFVYLQSPAKLVEVGQP